MAQFDQGDQQGEAPAPRQQTDPLAQLAALLVPAVLAALIPVGRGGALLKRKLFNLAPEMAGRIEQAATPVFLRPQAPEFSARGFMGTVESLPMKKLRPSEYEAMDLMRLSRPDIATKGRSLHLGLDRPSMRRLSQDDLEASGTLLHEGRHADLATQRFPSGIPGSMSPQQVVNAGMPMDQSLEQIQHAVTEFPDLQQMYGMYRPQEPIWRALSEMMTEYQSRQMLREAMNDPLLYLSAWKTQSQHPERLASFARELNLMSRRGSQRGS